VTAAPLRDAVEGEPVTVEATGRHIVITSGPQHRPAVVYLGKSDALALAQQILAADWLPDAHPKPGAEK
jgi:hypothetical protein